ncbi:type VI secretion system tube protein TssD, partial [Phocaeicola vulgatus]
IYETILKIRGMEVPILYYNYRCHIRHYDDPNLRKIIQLHIQVCEEIGNRECLPVEGDLITLAFECKGEEQFFYDWLNEGAMHNGEIHFIYNEVEIADIFRFWDCFCVKIEEYMSVGNSPMMMVLYLSPGIIKRNNLEVREKVWKVSEISDFILSQLSNEIKETEKRILSVSWSYGKDFIPLKQCSRHYTDINIHIRLKGYVIGEYVTLKITPVDNSFLLNNEDKTLIIRKRVDNVNELVIENLFVNYSLKIK